jgi:hypothetical protein
MHETYIALNECFFGVILTADVPYIVIFGFSDEEKQAFDSLHFGVSCCVVSDNGLIMYR